MDPTLYDLVLHAGIPLGSSAVAGCGAYLGVKYAIKDHAQRLDLILKRQTWLVRKFIAIGTQHNINHPNAELNLNDFPDEESGAFML